MLGRSGRRHGAGRRLSQGKNAEIANAIAAGADATIKADANVSGDGGKVIVGRMTRRARTAISAKGGAGRQRRFRDVGQAGWIFRRRGYAPSRPSGTLLLDPSDVNIGPADSFAGGSFSPSAVFGGAAGTASISWSTIDGELTNNNVVITTSGSGGSGNITVSTNSPTLNQSNNLWLVANNDITVNGTISNTGGGNVQLYAGWDGAFSFPTFPVTSGTGSITVSQNISISNAGTDLVLKAGKDISVGSGVTIGNLTGLSSNNTLTLEAVGGSITTGSGSSLLVTPYTAIAFGLPSTINLIAGGNITLTGTTISVTGGAPPSGGSGSAAPGGAATLGIQAGGTLAVSGGAITATGGNATPAPNSEVFGRGAAALTLSGDAGVSLTGGGAITAVGGAGSGTPSEDTNLSIASSAGNILIDSMTVRAEHRTGAATASTNDALLSVDAFGSITVSGASTLAAMYGRGLNRVLFTAETTIDISGGSTLSATGGDATIAGSAGGDANVTLRAGGITVNSSSLTARAAPVLERGAPLLATAGSVTTRPALRWSRR
jgi:hypothetical protein